MLMVLQVGALGQGLPVEEAEEASGGRPKASKSKFPTEEIGGMSPGADEA